MKKVVLVILSVILVASMCQGVFAADKIMLGLNAQALAQQAEHEELLAAFEEQHPDIMVVKPRTLNSLDVTFFGLGRRTSTRGLMKDLRPWIKGHEAEFAAAALTGLGTNGEIYELPGQMTATHVMYTNERLLKALGLTFPKTLDELIAQGEIIRKAGLIPIAMTNKAGWQMQTCLLSVLVERAGGLGWFDKATARDGASFTDPEFVNALSVIDTLVKNEMFMPKMNQADDGVALNQFIHERAVYYIDGGWRVNDLVERLTGAQKEYIGLETFPDIPNQKGQSGSTAFFIGNGYSMNANLDDEQAEAAWKWIWFYVGPEGSKIRQDNGALPTYTLPPDEDLDVMVKKLYDFTATTPGDYVLDVKMEGEDMGILHQAIQQMIAGVKPPKLVAKEYEKWRDTK